MVNSTLQDSIFCTFPCFSTTFHPPLEAELSERAVCVCPAAPPLSWSQTLRSAVPTSTEPLPSRSQGLQQPLAAKSNLCIPHLPRPPAASGPADYPSVKHATLGFRETTLPQFLQPLWPPLSGIHCFLLLCLLLTRRCSGEFCSGCVLVTFAHPSQKHPFPRVPVHHSESLPVSTAP